MIKQWMCLGVIFHVNRDLVSFPALFGSSVLNIDWYIPVLSIGVPAWRLKRYDKVNF